ncbi:MAG: hypothetical protein K1X67_01575 [Fimbriimonadaceae bacterium]|nr:hypothetical protein [Fimbriimonadaceae bacterium]
MKLSLPDVDVSAYKSATQVGRIITEAWGVQNLYCVGCQASRLLQTPVNARAVDFRCGTCDELYQLKSGKTLPKARIVDAAYDAMISSIRSERAPNLFYLHYDITEGVRDLLLIPRFFFTEGCIERRAPLGPGARRAGWVGCNIRLDRIPPEGRIAVVKSSVAMDTTWVRAQFAKMGALKNQSGEARGWTLAVLLELHHLGVEVFTIEQAYALEPVLQAKFPKNNNVRPKIRQQLQVLRDMGILTFLGGGNYRFE